MTALLLASGSQSKRKSESTIENPRPTKQPRTAPQAMYTLDLTAVDERLVTPQAKKTHILDNALVQSHRRSFLPECAYLLSLDDKRIFKELQEVSQTLDKQERDLRALLELDREGPRHSWTANLQSAETTVERLQKQLAQAMQDVADAKKEISEIDELDKRIPALKQRIEQDRLSMTHLQMESARRDDRRPSPFNELPLSLLSKIGSFVSYRHEIPEVAILSKTFYKSCTQFRMEFRRAPGIMVSGAGTEAVNGFYVRKDSKTSMPKNWPHSEDYWRRTTDGRPWYEGNDDAHITYAPLWYIHSASRPYYKVPDGEDRTLPVDEESWVQSLSGFGAWPCPILEFRDPEDPEILALREAQNAQPDNSAQSVE